MEQAEEEDSKWKGEKNRETWRKSEHGVLQEPEWEWGDTVQSELVKPSSELSPPPG